MGGGGDAGTGSSGSQASSSLSVAPGDYSCNPVTQNCANPDAKCELRDIGSGMATNYCDARGGGPIQVGQTCTREQVGEDNCAKGLICTRIGDQPNLACRKYCLTEADCGTGEGCADIGFTVGEDTGSARWGVCAQSCTAHSSTCPTDRTCGDMRLGPVSGAPKLYCRVNGNGPAGQTCAGSSDCLPNSVCESPANTCKTVCDADHPCATGTCNAYNGGANGLGTCG